MTVRATRYRINFTEEAIRKSTNLWLDTNEAKSYVSQYASVTKTDNFETMSGSTAMGAGRPSATANLGSPGPFDGRYVYVAPLDTITFMRYDTSKPFTSTGGPGAYTWEKLSGSSALGAALVTMSYMGGVFDGRYVYFAPYGSVTFLRYDTTYEFDGNTWTAAAWSSMGITVVIQGDPGNAKNYTAGSFDGRYVYFIPYDNKTFVRYDTTGIFTSSSGWEKIGMTAVLNADPTGIRCAGSAFDGQYVYYGAFSSHTFFRYNTQSAFTNTNSWEKMAATEANRGTNTVTVACYDGCIYDGRYVYYFPNSATTFLRYDTTQTFTTSTSWEKYSKAEIFSTSSDCGSWKGFDGRYLYGGLGYIVSSPAATATLARYDTTQAFSTSSSWQTANVSSILGAANSFMGATGDGKYLYFIPAAYNTIVRFKTMKSEYCPNSPKCDAPPL